MLLNRLEKALMNNPVREALQRYVEARRLLRLGGAVGESGVALEVGCGRGVGVELILDMFRAGKVDAFDLDPGMVELARQRLVDRGEKVRLWVGDAEIIEAPDAAYDAVFDFGILHHVPQWRSAVREVHRVLKPGGRFYAEEVLSPFLKATLVKRLFLHPEEDRFDRGAFHTALEDVGFRVVAEYDLWGRAAWFVADKVDRGALAS